MDAGIQIRKPSLLSNPEAAMVDTRYMLHHAPSLDTIRRDNLSNLHLGDPADSNCSYTTSATFNAAQNRLVEWLQAKHVLCVAVDAP